MRLIVFSVVVLLAVSVAWRYRGALGDLTGVASSAAPPARPIVFDNGTVRDPPPLAAPAGASATALAAQPGALRKCVRRGETTYTNFACPAGFKELGVASDRVTVLSGQGAPRPQAADTTPAGRRSALHDALDLSRDDRLRERMMDRAIEQGSR